MVNHRLNLQILTGLIAFMVLMIFFSYAIAGEEIDRGMIIYQANCLQCHGEKGDGSGPEAAQFNPGPADLTSTQMASVPDSVLEKAIVDGVPGIPMHSWGGILSKDDVTSLILYIRTLQK